ncbi:hypothetical protein SLITK23_27650 [Streptomyces lividans]|uniref:Serine phosphatase RsbU, regulator of sigma subunit n=3 Tax=Streptomyces TaxID=1883 RepID=A0A7U9DPK4_STRLI|nr:regulatory protein [Streptomyces lividans TK24]EOY47802.1 Serine phosphatase RsbU, regulator of sigma subunit [Streptomyces lividans 1326]KKD14940.1 regulatory protein [Streptomyces sp. WM6391]MYU42267.1 hypothetical protein [Streptomyces sp. SID7813]NSL83708.1 ATP-binding protein [Streptomyces coelicolor]QFI42849.1 ATP-binding protein [Streptomyces coelicolor A3(2)]QSJ11292.1 regulatory protein [Streptomyces lividans]
MHGLIRLVDVAELLATELVSNAVRHTKGPAALRIRWSPPGTLRIGAWDADPEPPEPPARFERVAELEEGRGLAPAGQARQPRQVRVVRAGGGLRPALSP